MQNNTTRLASSYRDPSGFIFTRHGIIYRQVNKVFGNTFTSFIQSGLYEKLVKQGLLLPHEVVTENLTGSDDWYCTLQPDPVSFITYPWEWSFDMLKDAALLTLHLTKQATDAGFILKDATPFNIQWHKDRLVLIDTLSFEEYNPDEPWIAYRQFCESFLAPLLLMHYSKKPLHQLLLAYPDGIPLDIASALLPRRSRFSLHTYLHIHLHAKVASKKNTGTSSARFSRQKLQNLLTSLDLLIRKLKVPAASSAWSAYYEEAAGRNDYLQQKMSLIKNWVTELPGVKTAADLGANDGMFSKELASMGINVRAADADPYCINRLYASIKNGELKNIQPLILDLSNPSPSIGVNNAERESFTARSRTDISLALALVHHLAIGKNIPFETIAAFLSPLAPILIMEWVPKDDEKIKLMLSQKKDIYPDYTPGHFEKAFSAFYTIKKKAEVGGSGRVLYLFFRHEG